eukprot:TCONS_00002157-protein
MKGKFCFHTPSEIKVVGSFLLKTMIKANHSIDIAVQMPQAVLHGKDYLNYRYYYKRAIYLSWLAYYLKDWEHTEDLSFTCGTNIFKPTLKINLKGKVGKKFNVVLHLATPEGHFKLSRFLPLKNNIRHNWYHGYEQDTTEEIEFPTADYNNGVLEDMLYEDHLRLLYSTLKECPGMSEAILLLKTWLKQRSYKGNVPFNGFCCSMLLVYLLSVRKISAHMSSYQMFRLTLHFIGTSDWSKEGITLNKDTNEDEKLPSLKDFHGVYPVVFVDSSGHLNLCSSLDTISYQMLRYEAQQSLALLDSTEEGSFELLFIKTKSFLQTVDHMFRINDAGSFTTKLSTEENNKLISYGGNARPILLEKMSEILRRGLDERITSLFMKPSPLVQWSVNESCPDSSKGPITVGVCLNASNYDNVLIMGPPADQPQAKEFRAFWGEKSELRRFQDGSINEAVVWPSSNSSQKKMVCKQIVQHLLKLHCAIYPSSIDYHGNSFDFILSSNTSSFEHASANQKKATIPRGCGEEESTHVIKTFEELSRQLRGLSELPLVVNNIHAVDPLLRMTEPLTARQYEVKEQSKGQDFLVPSNAKRSPLWCPVIKAYIQFEGSGQWPDNLEAIQHIRAAFHIKVAECIRQQLHFPAKATPRWIDVMKNGYVFRLSVIHYREMVLHKENVALGKSKTSHDIQAKKLEMEIVKKPLHNSLIHSLNGQFGAFSLTCRLAKRWMSSQMLSNHFYEELIELLVASVFLSPNPPNSSLCGFVRFLDHIATFDWNANPLIVNLNSEIKSESMEALKERFTNSRDHLPHMVVMTPYDVDGTLWTKQQPSPQVVKRLSLLAQAALALVESDGFEFTQQTIMQLFRPSTKDYDIVIELDKNHVPKLPFIQSSKSVHKSSDVKLASMVSNNVSNEVLPVVDFDPARSFLDQLQELFNDTAMFFCDQYGGSQIGVVWKRNKLAAQPFKIMNAKYKHVEEDVAQKKKKKQKAKDTKITTNEETMLKTNTKAIIQDFSILGQGLVKNIQVVNQV